MKRTEKILKMLLGDIRNYWSLGMFLVIAFFTAGFDVNCGGGVLPPAGGTIDPRFYQPGIGTNGTIYAVAEARTGMIFVGGDFTMAGSEVAHNIAVYDPEENKFHAVKNLGVNGPVRALAVSENDLFVGGEFTESADGERGLNNIARYVIHTEDSNEERWFQLTANGVDQVVNALVVFNNKLFVGGGVSDGSPGHGGVVMNGLAIYDFSGSGVWLPIANSGLNGDVYALALFGNGVIAGGNFTAPKTGGGVNTTRRIARFNLLPDNTSAWLPLVNSSGATGLNNTVRSLKISGDIYIGGDFTSTEGAGTPIPFKHIARYSPFGSQPGWQSAFPNDGLNGSVYSIALSGNKMYVGGSFDSSGDNNFSLPHIALFNMDMSGGGTWEATEGGGLNGDVYALAFSGNNLVYVGGRFTEATIASSPFTFYGFVGYNLISSPPNPNTKNASTEVVTTGFNPLGLHNGKALNNTISGLAADANGNIYAGGGFTTTSDDTVTGLNNIGRYDPATSTWTPLANGGLNGSVSSVAVDGNTLYVGGSFTRTADNTVILNRIARYDLTTNTWSAMPGNGLNGNGVSGVAISGSNLFVTGDFSRTTTSSVINLNRIARFNTSTNVWSPLTDNGLNGTVVSLAVAGNDLFAGGFFSQTFGGATTNLNFIARYNIATNTWSPLTGNGLNDSVKLSIFGDSLYMRGNFTQTFDGSIMLNKRAYYNTSTSTWSPVTGAQNDLDRAILANVMLRVGNELYIAGSFSEMGDAPAQYLTRIYLQKWNVPAANSDWFNDANWATGTAPTTNSNAVIPAGAGNINIASANVVMNDLNVNGGTLNIAAGRTLTINGILSLNGGTITGSGTVAITNCLPDGIMGGERVVYIQTTLVRCVNSTDPFVFPVGTANGYAPVIVRDIVGSGNVSVKANQGAYSNAATGLPVNRLTRWWQIENPGGGVTSSNVIFGYNDAEILGVESGYRAYRISGGNANLVSSTVNVYSNRVTATGVTGFSDWTLAQGVSTAAAVSVTGRVLTAEGRGITNAVMTITDQNGNQRTVLTGRFGTFRFDGLTAGETYVLSVRSRRFSFERPTQIISLVDNLDNVDFVALPPQVRSKALKVSFGKIRSVH